MTTEKREALKNKLNQAAQMAQNEPMSPAQTVKQHLENMLPTMSEILPKHLTGERLTRIAFNVIKTNPKLLECSIPSLLGAVMESAKLGLEPNMLGQCYLIPFNNKGKMEVQFIVGYQGLINLVRRSGEISSISAHAVHENDVFEYELGLEQKLVHKPSMNERGAIIGYYAVARLKDGGGQFHFMSKGEVEKYRDKYAKAKNFGPWVSEFDGMAKKTCIRQLIKFLPISIENVSQYDERSGADLIKDVETGKMFERGEAVTFDAPVDLETGEIL